MAARPINSARVRVSDIVDKWDMRAVHKLRDHSKAKKLSQGACLIAFNKAWTIGRIIDWKGGVHTYYAPKGEVFDLVSIRELVRIAFYVELEPGANAKRRAEELQIAA